MRKFLFMVVVSSVIALVGSSAFADIVLGTAESFAILGGSGVTNTGSSVINNGDVGSAPTPAVTGFSGGPGVVNNGTLHRAANSVTAKAHKDLIDAYDEAQTTLGGTTGPANLGGAILAPGVYKYAGAATWATAGTTLTLDAAGDPTAQWIFQIGSTLITPADATVLLLHGASWDNVFWQVGSSATLGANNDFAGNILAQKAITLGGGTLHGRALAIDEAVTISVAEAVTVPEPCTLLLLGIGLVGLIAKKRPISVV